jgi:pyruvate dehydrogenase E2 component (dihydrolipoamide acetyltransferase)
MEEGSVVEWLKQEGEVLERGEPLFVLETNKITFEVEAPESGVLGQILVGPGKTVPTGTTVGLILLENEQLAEPAELSQDIQAGPVSPEVKATPVARRLAEAAGLDIGAIEGTGTGGRVTTQDVERARSLREAAPGVTDAAASKVAPGAPPAPSAVHSKVKATPRAKRLAAEAGLDIAEIKGSGRDGRIMAGDVERTLAEVRLSGASRSGSAMEGRREPSNRVEDEDEDRVIPLAGVRGVIARRMSESSRVTAAVTTTTQVDATELVRLKDALGEERSAADELRPSYNDLLVVILTKALHDFPYMNAHLIGEQIVQRVEINIGLAVDTERGLVVPVLKDVKGMRLADITLASRELVERARGDRLLPDDLRGGTFTLSNLGTYDVDASTPIINLPECAVLGIGRIAPRPAVVKGELCVRETLTLSLTYDHRAIDGAPAARFLERVKQLVEQPGLALVR